MTDMPSTKRDAQPTGLSSPEAEGVEQDWSWLNDDDGWVPPVVDTTKPSVARIYDYGLGGKDNYPVDREAAHKFFEVVPDGREIAKANRTFLTRIVRQMAEAGIRQFLDLGTGIPTSPNVHETAREVAPDTAVVYVDHDPIVIAHNRALLQDDDRVVTIGRDLRNPASVLDDPAVRRLLDFDRPIGVLLISVLHFVDAAGAPVISSRYLHRLAPGSMLAITTTTSEGIDPRVMRLSEEVYTKATSTPLIHRTRAEIERLFEGTDPLVPLQDVYRSDAIAMLGGVGIKR